MSNNHNKEYSIFQIAMNLTAACFISGAIIAVTYLVTTPVAAEKAVMMKNDTMKALVEDAENFEPIEGKEDWFSAQKNGEVIGYVVPAESKGYGGTIKILVAVSPQGEIIDYDILAHNETPGLGDNAGKEPFKSQFKGKTSKDLEVVKDVSKKNNIQAMTGATISSKAVTKGIREAVEQVEQFEGGK
ncbi:RnfABCDGE type electron transport complex subunit G [Clostridium aminobutyricum]|uniref:Ion-translocating oxidoreductase complex subunit G n=1 Tax=Clostridium aminobutyricum TaxID=33953 RepID=A0A939D7V1_CLOAM|nr:RnfABCDGE type electron transport complex subunit G [Clostridium aminobutyricum]MBN7772418.1 RnfABCDGE type electron transport complex subunit G [Clostridium aminobutyricum]